jgi:hypothetical protein
MSVPLRSPRAWVAGVLAASALVLVPSTARATYTGMQDTVTLGRMTVGAGWIVVPELEQSVDPGFIDGTPSMTTTSSLQIARLSGRRGIHFDDRGVPYKFSLAMGAMSVAGTPDSLVAAWMDRTNGERIDTSTLNAKGQLAAGVDAKGELTNVVEQPAMPASGSFSLAGGPDGAYAVSWLDGFGAHAMVVPVRARTFAALLTPDVPLMASFTVVLDGGSSAWLVSRTAAGVAAAAVTLGQDMAPTPVALAQGSAGTVRGDDAGGLWVLAHDGPRWLAVHADRAGRLDTTALPATATSAVMTVDRTTAVVAYRAGPRCNAHLERLTATTRRGTPVHRVNLTAGTQGCASPSAIAVDPGTGTAYVLIRSRRGTSLVVTVGARVARWHGVLRQRPDAMVAAGSNRVVVQSHGAPYSVGEQCGGAAPSSEQLYTVRVFHADRLERSGTLSAGVSNC